uniref:Uncharacterized protein n=1 Tax=Caenorhabditis japonica TaxID=281687 RepID=A0A8R1I2S3_CAEJA
MDTTDNTMPSHQMLLDKMAENAEYSAIRAYIRAAISMVLRGTGEGRKNKGGERFLTDKVLFRGSTKNTDCITHTLIANWLDSNGYTIAAQMMKIQMSGHYVPNPQQYVIDKQQTIERLLKTIKIEVPGKLDRSPPKTVDNGHPFVAKVAAREFRREPIKIAPFNDEEWRKSMQEKSEWKSKATKQAAEEFEEDDSDDTSSSSSSTSSTSSTSSSSSSTSSNPEEDEKTATENVTKEPEKPSWGPSSHQLITDDPISTSHLPTISTTFPPLLTKKDEQQAIDKLFQSVNFDDDDEDDEEKIKDNEVVEKPKDVLKIAEPVEMSEGESIDELEDFDTGLLSSGGSDYSF